MSFLRNIPTMVGHFLDLVYPPLCFSCNEILLPAEQIICAQCKLDLPVLENPLVIERIKNRLSDISPPYLCCFLYYKRGNMTQQLLYSFKYQGYEAVGLSLGRWFGGFMLKTIDISNIDLIVPIPLHKSKLKKRGFNQSAIIAKGISEMTGIPVQLDIVKRISKNKSQTKKSRFSRMMNVKEIFRVRNSPAIENKHVLLVDDVITTGSTIASCATVLLNAGAGSVSIASLAAAQ